MSVLEFLQKNVASMLIAVSGVFIGFVFSLSFINSLGLGLILGAVSIFVFQALNKEKKISEPEVVKEKELDPIDSYENDLFNINYKIRLEGASENILEAAEQVIDKVRKLLPVLNTKENYSNLTVTVNRIPTRYLPSILNPYLELSETERKSIEDKILKNLSALNNELDRIQEAVDQGHKDSYQRMSTLIDNLFNENNVGNFNVSK